MHPRYLLMAVMLLAAAGFSACGDDGGEQGGGHREPESCDPSAVTPDIPLHYRIEADEDGPAALTIQTEGGDVRMTFTPWGPHAEPHTGHAGRDIKTNWQAFLAPDRVELETGDPRNGTPDGVCDPNETCGLPEETILARRPRYIAPDDGMVVTEVVLNTVHEPGFYYGTENHWRVEADLCVYHYTFGHVGWIAEDLRAAMIAAGAPDPETYTGPAGVNLLSEPIVLERGASIAIPQVVGATHERFPGMVIGNVWAQMEVPTRHLRRGDMPVYAWLEASVREDLQEVLWRDMQDPDSPIYGAWDESFDWLWKAESALYWSDVASRDDYSSLLSDQGSWFENRADQGPCTDGDPLCDQAISIWPITKTGPIYDETLYDSPATSFLVLKSKRGGTYFRGEVLQTQTLELTGTLLIKWRLESYGPQMESYQKLSFALDPGAKQLKLHWGEESDDRSAVESGEDPAIPTGLSCDGSKITCMNHEWHYGASFLPGF